MVERPENATGGLTPFEPDPVVEAYKTHVDRTLLRENLKRTPDERLRDLVRLQKLADEFEALREERDR